MAPARSSPPSVESVRRPRPERGGIGWRMALLLGLCLGLGYGLTHRLLRLSPGITWSGFQPFGVKAFPGTDLDTLRERYDAEDQSVRVDLDRLERERKQRDVQRREEEEMARRRAEMEARERRLEQDPREEEQPLQEEEEALPTPQEASLPLEPSAPPAADFPEPALPEPSAPRPPLDAPPPPPPQP